MTLLLCVLLAAEPQPPRPVSREVRLANLVVAAPAVGLLTGLAGWGALTWAGKGSAVPPLAMRLTVTATYAAGVALGVWLAGVRLNARGDGWWALAGAGLGAVLAGSVMLLMKGPEGDAAGASLAVMLPIFSSAALYELFSPLD